jgi:prephenate dehydratase
MSTKNIIAFQGVQGANSDLACRQNYPYMETKAYPTFDETMNAVENGEADICMIPIENSRAGRVAEIHNLLPHTNLYIVGEHFQRIEFFLMAPKGATLDTVEEIHSHPQALMQCKDSINKINKNKKGKKITTVQAPNTATAAKQISDLNDITKAAIAPLLSAELYGLEILQKNVEDDDQNTTIFVAMASQPIDIDPNKKNIITSLFFQARNIPAALYKALGGFATNNVNLLKIESYIPGGHSKHAQFFVSFEGHPEDRNVRLAIEELGFFSNKVKMLGVYIGHQTRFEN